eukprot:gnl/Chilomastix_cuspidata/956.p1 GENE.gnl/Chilomastix_cuspidata/956~~gnl/Chilomastix_cuspidata/956.p1  ORF type:complete len:1094 (+),score=253.00 gnl/Chilomastix_cuspidata/956:32-3313(+)
MHVCRGRIVSLVALFLAFVAPSGCVTPVTPPQRKMTPFLDIFDDSWDNEDGCVIRFSSQQMAAEFSQSHSIVSLSRRTQTYLTDCFDSEDFSTGEKVAWIYHIRTLPGVEEFRPVKAPQRLESRTTPTDPAFVEQWYLKVEGSNAESDGLAVAGVDVNIEPAWDLGLTGVSQNIVVVDTGIQWDHPDLVDNYNPDYSYSYNSNPAYETAVDPEPISMSMDHGTATTSLIASSWNNDVCMSGVAPEVSWSGRFLIDAVLPDMDGAMHHALSADCEDVSVFSNSWGFTICSNSYCNFETDYDAFTDAIDHCAANGNGGRGSVYIFASGNDGRLGAHTNLGLECRHSDVLCVGAITSDGVVADYTTFGSALFITAPSGGTTTLWNVAVPIKTARNIDECASYSGGTSFSCPLVSSITTLMFDANEALTHRDARYILQRTARPIDVCGDGADCSVGGWITNGAGIMHSPYYGFGLVDAGAATELAASWSVETSPSTQENVFYFLSETGDLAAPLPKHDGIGWSFSFSVEAAFMVLEDAFVAIEWLGKKDGSVPSAGRVIVELESPAGTRSQYTSVVNNPETVTYNGVTSAYIYPQYMRSLQFWGEDADGDWELTVWYDGDDGDEHYLFQASVSLSGIEKAAALNQTMNPTSIVLVRGEASSVYWTANTALNGYDAEENVGFVVSTTGGGLEIGSAAIGDNCTALVLPDDAELSGDRCCMYVGDASLCDTDAENTRTLWFPLRVSSADVTIVSPADGGEALVGDQLNIVWILSSDLDESLEVTLEALETGEIFPVGTFEPAVAQTVFSLTEEMAGACTISATAVTSGTSASVTVNVILYMGEIEWVMTGGDVYTYNYQHVTYSATDMLTDIAFELVSAGGVEYLIADDKQGSGEFDFIVPDVSAGEYFMRATSQAGNVEATSLAFSIEHQAPLSGSVKEKSSYVRGLKIPLTISRSDAVGSDVAVAVESTDETRSRTTLLHTTAEEVKIDTTDIPFTNFRFVLTSDDLPGDEAYTDAVSLTNITLGTILLIAFVVLFVAVGAFLFIFCLVRSPTFHPRGARLDAEAPAGPERISDPVMSDSERGGSLIASDSPSGHLE